MHLPLNMIVLGVGLIGILLKKTGFGIPVTLFGAGNYAVDPLGDPLSCLSTVLSFFI